MPISFTINKSRQTLKRQWEYLFQRGQPNLPASIKKFVAALVVTTGLYLAFYFFTDVNRFVAFKVVSMVLIVLAWLVSIIVFLPAYFTELVNKRKFRHFLSTITNDHLNYSVCIDDEKVTITSPFYAYDLPWTEFDCYGLYNETVYVFNRVTRFKSLYWDRTEMGTEAYTGLLQLLKNKGIEQVF